MNRTNRKSANIREKYKLEATDESGKLCPTFGTREKKSLIVDYNLPDILVVKDPVNFRSLMESVINKPILSGYKEDILKASRFHLAPTNSKDTCIAYYSFDDNGLPSVQYDGPEEPIFYTLLKNISKGIEVACELAISEYRFGSALKPCLRLHKDEIIFVFEYEFESSCSKMLFIFPHYLVEIYELKFGCFQPLDKGRLPANSDPVLPSVQIDIQYGNLDLDRRLVNELKPGDVLITDSLAGDLFKILLDDKIIALGVAVVVDNNMAIRIVKVL
jgi:hypothetical protein